MDKTQKDRLQQLKTKKESGIKTLKVAFFFLCTASIVLLGATFYAYFIQQINISMVFLLLPTLIMAPAILIINRIKKLKEVIEIIEFQLAEIS